LQAGNAAEALPRGATANEGGSEQTEVVGPKLIKTKEIMVRKIIASLFISLDGVTEAPDQWHFPYFNDEMGQAVGSQIEAADTMLLGRRTYEEFASYWPHQGSEVELADQMNSTPKLVVSDTLSTLEWQNSTLIKGDVAERLTGIKQQPGKNIGITGSSTLVRSLLRDGVLDELRLLVHPIVVGKGKRLFPNVTDQQALTLVESKTFSTGVLYLTYALAQ
jgi:dihydrofolate reductase